MSIRKGSSWGWRKRLQLGQHLPTQRSPTWSSVPNAPILVPPPGVDNDLVTSVLPSLALSAGESDAAALCTRRQLQLL